MLTGPSPLDVPPRRYTAIAVRTGHACAITESAAVVCWGGNEYGQTEAPPGRYTAITSSKWGSCALAEIGKQVCWGKGERAIDVPPGRFTAVDVSDAHGCAITAEGAVVCWGGFRGADPVKLLEGTYTAVSVGHTWWEGDVFRSCALTEEGIILCWEGRRQYLGRAR